MFKFILFIVIVLFVIGSGDVFDFSTDSSANIWIITVNYQELLWSVANGFNIVYDFISELIQSNTDIASPTTTAK